MERVHAARAAIIEEGESGWSAERQASAIYGHIGDVVSDESVGFRQDLLFAARVVELDQTIGRGNVDHTSLRVRQNAVYAKHMFVFHMPDAAFVHGQKIQAAIEIANPELSVFIRGQGRDVAVIQHGYGGREHTLPSESMKVHAVESVASEGKYRAA